MIKPQAGYIPRIAKMTEKEVEDYIKVQRSLGVSASDIHKALINAGYTEDEFLHTLHKHSGKTTGRTHTTSGVKIIPKHLVFLNLTVIFILIIGVGYLNHDYRKKLELAQQAHDTRLAELETQFQLQADEIDQRFSTQLMSVQNDLKQEIDSTKKGLSQSESRLLTEIQAVNMKALTRDKELSDSVQGTAHRSLTELSNMSQQLAEFKAQSVDFTPVIPKALEAVVTIGEKGAGYFSSTGSGVMINNKGYVVTNWHVVDELSRITVKTHNGGEFTGSIVDKDEDLDIAVLKLSVTRENFDYLTFADSDKAFIGQHVIAVGNPQGFESTVTEGIISNTDRIVTEDHDRKYIQTDVAVNKGNSGGPLITKEGEIIGIVTLKHIETGSEGLSFALKSNDVYATVFAMLLEE